MNDENQKRPPLSFVLLAYNQEQFIREAVQGAFSQTYSPLEIILSDDCSPDQTCEIMHNMAKQYQGPNKVIVRRNASNLGIGAHINEAFKAAHGEWIIVAAGDDISLPQRAEVIFRHVTNNNAHAAAACSLRGYIDAHSNDCGQDLASNINTPFDLFVGRELLGPKEIFNTFHGSTAAYRGDVWHRFGSIPPSIVSEDRILYFRAKLLGNIVEINQVLVKYRQHVGIATTHLRKRTFQDRVRFTRKMHLCRRDSASQMIQDARIVGVGGSSSIISDLQHIQDTESLKIRAIDGDMTFRELSGALSTKTLTWREAVKWCILTFMRATLYRRFS